MKIKLFISLICLFTFASLAYAQTEEARKVTEINHFTPCGEFLAQMDWVYSEHDKSAESKIFVVYYEGKHEVYAQTNERLRWVIPRRGDAFSRAREVPVFLMSGYRNYKISKDTIVLIDGGYRERFGLEIWVVPKNAELPRSTPTLTVKDIKFRRGKPYKIRDFTGCY